MHPSDVGDSRNPAPHVDRALINYLAIIVCYSQVLLRECAEDDARRREIQEIHDAAAAAVQLISTNAPEPVAPADRDLRAMEREHIVRMLGELHGNKAAAAKRLGISRRTLYRRLARHGLMPAIGADPQGRLGTDDNSRRQPSIATANLSPHTSPALPVSDADSRRQT